MLATYGPNVLEQFGTHRFSLTERVPTLLIQEYPIRMHYNVANKQPRG